MNTCPLTKGSMKVQTIDQTPGVQDTCRQGEGKVSVQSDGLNEPGGSSVYPPPPFPQVRGIPSLHFTHLYTEVERDNVG